MAAESTCHLCDSYLPIFLFFFLPRMCDITLQERRTRGWSWATPLFLSFFFWFNYSHNAVKGLSPFSPLKKNRPQQTTSPVYLEKEVAGNWRRQWKSTRMEKEWRTRTRLIFLFTLPSLSFLFLSGYVTGGFINHWLDSLCQGELTAFGPIRRCRDNRNSTSCASMLGAKRCLPVIT